jgi:hypothetical protein
LVDAALQAGLLARASDNARRAVEGVVRALGYEQIEVTVLPPPKSASAAPSGTAE